ncbi:hypothetical protein Ancab_020026 [Ancistrocladus abbreviatus]
MANNDIMINGVNDALSEFDDFTTKKTGPIGGEDNKVVHADQLNHRVEELERDKREREENVKKLEAEIEELMKEKTAMKELIDELKKAENEKSELESKALKSIAKRTMELETEVARLQHDLISSMNAGEEANREIEELRGEIEGLKGEKAALEADSDMKISDLERKQRMVETEKAKTHENANAKMDEREGEEEVEESVSLPEAKLKKSEEKGKEMEAKSMQLMGKSKESDKMISGLMEKAATQGSVHGLRGGDECGGFKGLKVPLPVAWATSTTVVLAMVVVCCIRYSRTGNVAGMWLCEMTRQKLAFHIFKATPHGMKVSSRATHA